MNTCHLFGHITRARIEPEFQTLDGGRWTARDLRFKPGAPGRASRFVAPHRPRLDFQLWFYGLSFREGTARYVPRLLERMCDDPSAVGALFDRALAARPDAVRVVFYRYRYTTPGERRATGAVWRRDEVAATGAMRCR